MRHTVSLSPIILFLLLFPSTASTAPSEQLSFDQRLQAHRALEAVYWHHRIWPETNPGEKPSLDAVLSESALRTNVEDSMRKSAALEELWNRPITAEALQAELDRMARSTRRPAMLRELFAALDEDPFKIAESLARPLLADRLIREYYAKDERFHAELLRQVQADLEHVRDPLDLRNTSGNYVETTWLLTTERMDAPNLDDATIVIETEDTWRQLRARIHRWTGSNATDPTAALPVGRIGEIRKGADSIGVVAVVSQADDSLVTVSVTWPRTSFETWWRQERLRFADIAEPTRSGYTLPVITGTTCTDDTWSPTLAGAADARYSHTAIWTGAEMIVWGGRDLSGVKGTGGRYRPSTDTWATVSTANAPSGREGHSVVWTGQEMTVWGGINGSNRYNDGGHYSPSTDTWVPTGGGTQLPSARAWHSAVWGGGRMTIWGGAGSSGYLNTGATYNPFNPGSFRWSTMTTAGAPSARAGHVAVWAGTGVSGTEMVVWGGFSGFSVFHATGGRYNVSSNTWAATNTTGAPTARRDHTAVWSGTEMIVWGGWNGSTHLNTGGRYNPSSNMWSATSTGANVPAARGSHSAIWVTGTEMIVWGGFDGGGYPASGGHYDPGTDSWTGNTTGGGLEPTSRDRHTAVWASTEMIVWGGFNGNFVNPLFSDGGRYDPFADTWTQTSTGNAPRPRSQHTSVWTGSEMILFGGFDSVVYTLTGHRYDPATDSWTTVGGGLPGRSAHVAVWTGTEMVLYGGWNGVLYDNTGKRYNPTTGIWTATTPFGVGRVAHSAVWTGREMIVWGGFDQSFNRLNTGGRYDPGTDLWTATSVGAGVPSSRSNHSTAWTGREMIVWGGSAPGRTNTGSRYDSATDSWTVTSTGTNVPSARRDHTAVWAGAEMVVWGGDVGGLTQTGGRYDPVADAWTATSTGTNVPSARSKHTAVWTREEMIVWGGLDSTGGRYDIATDAWTPTSLVNPASGRGEHTAVWTGEEMIVWGGTPLNSVGSRYCACASAVPATTPVLAGSRPSPGTLRLSWAALVGATSYDVVSGKLSTLRSSGGDYSQSTDRCLLNNQGVTTIDDTATPAAGDAFWYLGRGANCGGAGSYDSGGANQSALRDAQIEASGFACP